MKNKNIKISSFIFLVWLVASLFWFGKNCLAEDAHTIIISAVQTSGAVSNDDFIELYNTTCKDIALSDWKIIKKTKTSTTATSIGTLKNSIPAKGYFLWKNIENNSIGTPDYTTKTYYLSDDYSVALLDKTGKQIDSITWGANQNPFENTLSYATNLKKLEALTRSIDNIFSIKENYSPKNSSFIETSELDLCQKDDPIKDDDPPTEKIYSDKIIINELLPAPSADSGSEEFIELYNPSEKDEDLSGWILRDSSKTGKYTFPEKTTLKSKDFLVVPKTDFKFALNNSGGEKISLFDPAEKVVSAVEYTSSAKADYAYAFDGSNWQWTSKVTKGAENEFDKLISGKVQKDDPIYANVYANFEANVDKKAKHFTWNFGDDHKSYLEKTRHKYEKTGTYEASLKITGDGKENLINFTVEVEKFGKAKIKIVGLSANPKGSDSESEWLEIWNNTKKKIDLNGWSVATGWKNLYNHPITKKFSLKAGETKKLTQDFCAFTLGNKQAKIELRYPDGKVADKIKYDRKDASISEDELYQKTTTGWDWTTPEKEPTPISEESESPTEPLTETPPEEKPEEINADIDLSLLGKSTENPAWQQKQEKQIALVFAGSNISPPKILAQNQGQVLGISTENNFQFTSTPEKTWKSIFSFDFIWKKINAKLNWMINSV